MINVGQRAISICTFLSAKVHIVLFYAIFCAHETCRNCETFSTVSDLAEGRQKKKV